MQLMQYLICVATRHEQAKEVHEDELSELRSRENKKNSSRKSFTLTYEDEAALLKSVISSVSGRPACLKKRSYAAIAALAYIIRAKLANDQCLEGHEIVDDLVCNPEEMIVYLNALDELKKYDWIRLVEKKGLSLTDQPPYCWIQSGIELGDAFHKEMGATYNNSLSFTSNDAFLDSVFAYMLAIEVDKYSFQVSDPSANLATLQPDGWYRKIAQRVQSSSCTLPAAQAQEKYSLSTYQFMAILGLLGAQQGDLCFDFCDTREVIQLFSRGRICRRRMREHLYGKKSKLIEHRLIEGTQGEYGETVRLTHLGFKTLLGRQPTNGSLKELKERIKKSTRFDFEEPKIKTESILLPPQTLESIRSLIFSESKEGKRIRKSWQSSLPATWESPTGSTVLLYGPPGTGKTLTAQYLASELKLPMLKIDSAQILSCWVGESEQNVRRIFDDYTMLQKEFGKSPVLLLNEADQLLGSRGTGQDSVDRMNNNMQNLFLEGLERFSGIMVATTNRRDLLDDAFSRRFTYKLELPPPDRNLRIGLWKSHLPMERLADDVDIENLADLELSGGEIRLVIERTVRLLAFRGVSSIDTKTLRDIAQEELASRMKKLGTMNRIGF